LTEGQSIETSGCLAVFEGGYSIDWPFCHHFFNLPAAYFSAALDVSVELLTLDLTGAGWRRHFAVEMPSHFSEVLR
jgi:hypothetical protein